MLGVGFPGVALRCRFIAAISALIVVEQIIEKTDGVPLFVEELTRAVLEQPQSQGLGDPLGGHPNLPVPATLHVLEGAGVKLLSLEEIKAALALDRPENLQRVIAAQEKG